MCFNVTLWDIELTLSDPNLASLVIDGNKKQIQETWAILMMALSHNSDNKQLAKRVCEFEKVISLISD